MKSGSRICVLSLCLSLPILPSSDGSLEKILFGREISLSRPPSLMALLELLVSLAGGPEVAQLEITPEQYLKRGSKVGRQAA